jgi:hypothetical protein
MCLNLYTRIITFCTALNANLGIGIEADAAAIGFIESHCVVIYLYNGFLNFEHFEHSASVSLSRKSLIFIFTRQKLIFFFVGGFH